MKRFKSAGQAQRFLSAHDGVNSLFYLRRNHVTASEYRAARARAFGVWSDVSGAAARTGSPLTLMPIHQSPCLEVGKLTVPS